MRTAEISNATFATGYFTEQIKNVFGNPSLHKQQCSEFNGLLA